MYLFSLEGRQGHFLFLIHSPNVHSVLKSQAWNSVWSSMTVAGTQGPKPSLASSQGVHQLEVRWKAEAGGTQSQRLPQWGMEVARSISQVLGPHSSSV